MSTRKDAWDFKALRFAVGFPLLLAFAFAVAGFTFNREVPRGVVLPVGGPALAFPGFLAAAAAIIAVPGWAVGSQAARTRISAPVRRVLMGLAVAVPLFLAALMAAALVAQADTDQAPSARVDSIVLASGSGAAVALGVVMAFIFKPDEQWTRRDQAALARELDPDLERDYLVYWIRPRSSVAIMIVLAGLLPGALLAVLLPWLGVLVLLLALAVLLALTARVSADRDGASVAIAGMVPALRIRPELLQGAAAAVVEARLYGGWGARRKGTSGSFLAGSGPAVVVRMDDGGSYVLGAPTENVAEQLAALLNRRAGEIGNANL